MKIVFYSASALIFDGSLTTKSLPSCADGWKSLMKKYSIPTAAYETFTDADKAIAYIDKINAFLIQSSDDKTDFDVVKNELIKLANLI